MRLGVLSDTHDQLARTRFAIELLKKQGAEVLVHCGDLTGPEIVTACAALPCYFVFGNHDPDRVPDLQRAAAEVGVICLGWGAEVTIAGKRVAVAHGHMHTDIRRLMAAQPDFLFT
ncbi:MAG TPA: metallophosphoesterase family protein, partial [Gemmataceae bacterium]